jgi:hypothetical protein
MTSLLNFIKIYQLVQKLLEGTHRQTDRQTSDLISLTSLFKEISLKIGKRCFIVRSLCDVHEINSCRADHVCLFIRPSSVRMIQLENRWTDLDKILYERYAIGA